MRYLIAGGSGFIGSALVQRWLAAGHIITVLGRDTQLIAQRLDPRVKTVSWQQLTTNSSALINLLKNQDAIINLAGANIGEKRWSKHQRQIIMRSRVESTQVIAQACAQLGTHSPPLLNASAVGIYPLQTSLYDNTTPVATEAMLLPPSRNDSFLAQVAKAWEAATIPAREAEVRVINMRFGVVLAPHGGVLPQLITPIKWFLGGRLGNGQQPFAWISLTDVCGALEFLLQHTDVSGPINLVAPNLITQQQLTQTLATALHRPSALRIPALLLRLGWGQMAKELLLRGQKVKPQRLLELGYKFVHPTLADAVQTMYG